MMRHVAKNIYKMSAFGYLVLAESSPKTSVQTSLVDLSLLKPKKKIRLITKNKFQKILAHWVEQVHG